MSVELTKEQQCTLMANAEYQKIVPIIMNLATLSLALPFVFIKEFQSSLGQKGTCARPLAMGGGGMGVPCGVPDLWLFVPFRFRKTCEGYLWGLRQDEHTERSLREAF
jgi:hypothetical protein